MKENFEGKRKLVAVVVILLAAVVVVVMAVNMLGKKAPVTPKTNTNTTTNQNAKTNEPKNYTTNLDGNKINVSKDVAENKKVGDILIEKSKIVYQNGTSLLTSKVTNDSVAKDNLRFKVKFVGNDGKTIAESVGFVGQIKANETKYIDSYITLDVANAKDVVYELMK